MSEVLTSLPNVKDWLNIPAINTNSDALLSRLILAGSAFLLNWINHPLAIQSYTDTFDGNGQSRQRLRQWPINSISSVVIGSTVVPPSTDRVTFGYTFDDQYLRIIAGTFGPGMQNVQVTYTAGYSATDTLSIPATPYQVIVTSLSRHWSSDYSVLMAGAAMTKVIGTPATGQYAVDALGNYTFAAADTGKSVVITYGTTPIDVEQGCIELIGAKYKTKNRIGMSSETVNAQATAFSATDLRDDTKAMLQNYRKVVPI
jgi:hypothetical protein